MKKFKTKANIQKIKIFFFIVVFIIIFILISLFKLNASHVDFTNILLKEFSNDTSSRLRFLTSNLDQLFNSYTFKDKSILYQQKRKVIYLYTTHDQEKYYDNSSVFDAMKSLKNNLTKLGIDVILEEKHASELLHTGLSYYKISRTFINDVMSNNIAFFIDIHRDSVTDTTIKINNKNYAKILFVLGLENKNYLKNKAIISKMNDYLNKNYPGISKGIYEKKGDGVDGVYNQDLSENVLLIEIGGIKNNIEEVNNSTEILSLMLYHMLGD